LIQKFFSRHKRD